MNLEKKTIIVRELTKRFGSFTAVNDISFEVKHGEIFGFLGPNGSGKTTTIRMMLGVMRPTSGSIEVLGIDVDGHTKEIRPRVGYMSQRFSLYNDLTVKQNMRFYGSAYGISSSELDTRISEALSMAGLEGRESAKTKELAGGWRQRLALSAAILHRPEVLFLDEPTAGVDPLSRRAFWNLLYALVAKGVTVFVTTHYMDEAEHCQRLAFIQHGSIIAYGTPTEIKSRMMSADVLEIEPSDPQRAIKVLRTAQANHVIPIDEVELYGGLIHIIAQDVHNHQEALIHELQKAGIRADHLSIIEPSLEDVFISAMKS